MTGDTWWMMHDASSSSSPSESWAPRGIPWTCPMSEQTSDSSVRVGYLMAILWAPFADPNHTLLSFIPWNFPWNSHNISKILSPNMWITGWWCGTVFYDFPYIGNFIIPTDELIFFRGVGIPPTRDSWRLTKWGFHLKQPCQPPWLTTSHHLMSETCHTTFMRNMFASSLEFA